MNAERTKWARVVVALVVGSGLLGSCGGGAAGRNDPSGASFLVVNSAGIPVAGATVYLVPAADVDTSPISGQDVLDGTAENRDEPLEDAVALHGASYHRGVTDASGRTFVGDLPHGRYFWFVSPGPGDNEHLPGGSGSRRSIDSSVLLGNEHAITLSSQPGPAAVYLGTTTCMACHYELAGLTQHAHRLGFTVPGQFTSLQDPSRYPDFQGNWQYFLVASSFAGGTPVYFSDFDPSRGFDKFKTSLSNPTSLGETLYAIAWLWRDTSDNRFKITLQNVINPGDPGSPRTLVVELTYGGAVYKQRNLLAIPGRSGLYPFLQWQSEGDDNSFDRTRRVFRDYHLDWFWDDITQTFTNPPIGQNFEGNCTGCHSTGFVRFQDANTGEWLSDAVNDPNGAYDIDGDGTLDEINLGCEVCHGPGSDHVAWVSDPANAGRQARYIVTPDNLSPSRAAMLCGRCHDRPLGNGPVVNEEPLNPLGERAPPGIGRAAFLAEYVSRKGPALEDYWADEVHSRSHHQQYSDLIKSAMHRNDRILTVCFDCHDLHGLGPFEHHLRDDPQNANSNLCLRCHAVDHFSHMLAVTGTTHGGAVTTCVRCHLTGTAKSGAGRYGILLALPTPSSGPNTGFFENDIASHLFVVPRKTHPSVAGALPAAAMPIPYTNSCGGPCHDPSQLENMSPTPLPLSGTMVWPSTPTGNAKDPDGFGTNQVQER